MYVRDGTEGAYEKLSLDLVRCSEIQQRSAECAAKAMRGEQTEDVSKWILKWEVPDHG